MNAEPAAITATASVAPAPESGARTAVLSVLGAVSFSHFLNDLIQSLLPSIYPMLKSS